MTTFAAFREFTGRKRPGRDHAASPSNAVKARAAAGIMDGVYRDIDLIDKLKAATGRLLNSSSIRLYASVMRAMASTGQTSR